jgi:hypothetical protein
MIGSFWRVEAIAAPRVRRQRLPHVLAPGWVATLGDAWARRGSISYAGSYHLVDTDLGTIAGEQDRSEHRPRPAAGRPIFMRRRWAWSALRISYPAGSTDP